MEDAKKLIKDIISKFLFIFAGIFLTIALIGAIIAAFIKADSASAYSGNYSDYVNLGDYIVKTDDPGAMPALTKQQLEYGIKANYSGQIKDNLLSWVNAFIKIQDKYKINAAFTVAVSIAESSAGTNWDLIASSTNNILLPSIEA